VKGRFPRWGNRHVFFCDQHKPFSFLIVSLYGKLFRMYAGDYMRTGISIPIR
jgi:hypothetical protein